MLVEEQLLEKFSQEDILEDIFGCMSAINYNVDTVDDILGILKYLVVWICLQYYTCIHVDDGSRFEI